MTLEEHHLRFVQTSAHHGAPFADLKLESVQESMEKAFHLERWDEMANALDDIASLAQSKGARQLCLLSQSMSQMIRQRADRSFVSPAYFGERVEELKLHLSHLSWSNA